jgi:FkbM family methyltransferase
MKRKAGLLKPFSIFRGRKTLQTFFDKLHKLAIIGKYDNRHDFFKNGETDLLRQMALHAVTKRPLVIFDVGANSGEYASEIFRIFSKHDIFIHVFEPVWVTYEKLILRLKEFSNRVKFNRFGLGGEAGKMMIQKYAQGSGIASIHGNSRYPSADTEEIEIQTLDDYCQRNSIDEIDFLKIDVEGHDLFVLEGGRVLLQKTGVKVIQFEFGPNNINSRTYFRNFYDLLKADYNLYRIVPNGLVPVRRYEYTLEVFGVVANFMAIRKKDDYMNT